MDRKGGLRRFSAQGVLQALPGQRSAAALRLRGEVRRHEGRRRSLHPLPRLALGIPRRREVQSEGEHPLGERKTCARGQGAPLRPPVPAPEPGKDRDSWKTSIRTRAAPSKRRSSRVGNLVSRQPYQFERHGYFIADYDRSFNRTVTLRDSGANHDPPEMEIRRSASGALQRARHQHAPDARHEPRGGDHACARRGGKAMGRNGGDSPQGEDRRPPPRARRERHLCSERKGTHALGREPRVHGRGRAGDFIYVPPYVPHQEINASDTEPLSCVLCRSGREPVVVNLPDLPVAEKPEEVRWVDDLHKR